MFIHSVFSDIINYDKTHIGLTGFAATIIGIISFLPVLYIVYRTKKTENFPFKALLLALISNVLWIYYAIAKGPVIDIELAFSGLLYFFIYSFILYTKIFH